MKKIVIDARELRTSSGRYVERLLHYLQQVDKEHTYVVLLTPKDFTDWEPTNPQFTKLVCPYKEFTFSEQLGMYRHIKNIKADLVHFPFVQQPVCYRGTVVTTIQDLTTLRFRNPTKHWLLFTIKQWVYWWVNKYVARKSKLLITPTEYVKEDIQAFTGVSARKITVTLEAADPIPYPPTPLKRLQSKGFIMYVGRPTPHKNLLRLIKAFALLRQQHPSLRLVLVGKKDAMYQLIEHQARREGLLDGVIFTGFVSESELRWLFENCQAYVFPSLSEGFGLPAVEAMVHGGPVVASTATCIPEVCGPAAHYFDPLDIEDMASKINEVLTDQTLRASLIRKGYDQAAKYSWKRMAEQTLGVYKKALGEK